jgi:hypothetical protein
VVGSTGVTGLTLGGGIGHLTAQYGLTCDNLVAAELVTPAGEIVRASEDQNPERVWEAPLQTEERRSWWRTRYLPNLQQLATSTSTASS